MKQFKINKNNRPQPLPRAFNRVKQGSVAGQNWVLDSVRFNLTPINTQSIPDHHPNQTARWDRRRNDITQNLCECSVEMYWPCRQPLRNKEI